LIRRRARQAPQPGAQRRKGFVAGIDGRSHRGRSATMPIMSFPLGSLGGGGAATVDSAGAAAAPRWRQQAWLLLGGLAWLLFVLAMLTYHPGDPAFTTSGTGEGVRNRAGLVGARVSDLMLFLLGHSAWWLVPVALRAWLAALAGLLRGPQAKSDGPRWLFWVGLAVLLAASCALESTRLYRWEPLLPDHAGGVLGHTLGPRS